MITQISQGSGGGGVDTDEKSKVSSNDTTAGYLNGKLVAGTNVTLTENNDGGNETLTISSADTNDQAKVSNNDTTAGYLNGKLVAGTNITFTENNDGGNETLTIAAAGGVTGFTGSQNTASPNNTVNASRLLVDAASTNADAVLQPKGTGAVLAQLPDSTTTGGNKRGQNAVDLQTNRASSTRVASGNYSVLVGGQDNRATNTLATNCGGISNSASGERSFIGGGGYNISSGTYANISGGDTNSALTGRSFIGAGQSNSISTAGTHQTIAGGQSNTASATHTTISGGESNIANNAHATVGGGQNNTASQSHATVAGGISNTASGTFSAIIGGSTNTASGAYSVASGFRADADKYGMRSHASGQFAAVGDAQLQEMVMRRVTTDNAQVELSADGDGTSTHQLQIVNDTTIAFDILVVARRTDADNESAAWNVTGCIDNNNNVCALVGTPSVTSLGDDSAGAWLLSVAAEDATVKRLKILATGQTGKTIRWVAHVRSVKVTG